MQLTDIPTDSATIGTVLLSITTLLGAYLLVLRIRASLAEKPDPKLTYATHKQLDKLNINQKYYEKENKKDYVRLEKQTHDILQMFHQLVSKNAQKIAAIQTQTQMNSNRITELTLKTDKLLKLHK